MCIYRVFSCLDKIREEKRNKERNQISNVILTVHVKLDNLSRSRAFSSLPFYALMHFKGSVLVASFPNHPCKQLSLHVLPSITPQ